MPSTFKTSTSKTSGKNTCNLQKLGTVESRHQEQLQKFSQLKKELPNKKRQLKTLQRKLKTLEKTDSKEIREYVEMIEELQKTISDIENENSEQEYLMDVGLILMKYHDNLENPLSDSQQLTRNKIQKLKTESTTRQAGKVKNQTSLGSRTSLGSCRTLSRLGTSKRPGSKLGVSQMIGKKRSPPGMIGLGNTSRRPNWGGSVRSQSELVINQPNIEISCSNESDVDQAEEGFDKPMERGTILRVKNSKEGSDQKESQTFRTSKDLISGKPKIKTGISDYFTNNQKNNSSVRKESRFELLDQFLCKTDSDWVAKSQPIDVEPENTCPECGVLRIIIPMESKLVCPCCGWEHITLLETDRISYKDPPPEMNYFAYRRINHFNELLVQFQAKESTNIPKEVYEMILKELKKERKTVKQLDYNLVKKYLKKYSKKNFNQYYDHIFYIIYRLNGEKPLTMTPEMEETLRSWFLRIQEPFEKYCPPGRKNFISYNFVFYKFCEMLGYYEFLKYFPLLKSKEKRYEQEKIWEKVIADIGLA